MDIAESSPVTTRVPKPSVDTELLSKACGSYFDSFTLKEINSCIIASETMRVLCSITIALLVVLSYVNIPRNIVKSQSIIVARPLYIVLLTDVAIVLVRFLLKRHKDFEKAKEEGKMGMREHGHNWAVAVNVLEMGLVLHQTIRAIFIDCSFYLVVVICGRSLV